MDMETGNELWTVHRKMSTEISLVLLKSREILIKHSEINITENPSRERPSDKKRQPYHGDSAIASPPYRNAGRFPHFPA